MLPVHQCVVTDLDMHKSIISFLLPTVDSRIWISYRCIQTQKKTHPRLLPKRAQANVWSTMNYSKLKRINLVRSSLFLPDRWLGFFLCDFNFLGTKLITLVHDCSHFIIIHTYNNINPPNTYKKFGHYFMFILKLRNCFHLVNPSQGIALKIKGIHFSKM